MRDCQIAPRAFHHEDIAMTSFAFRRDFITKPIFSWARTVLPAMSDTEREALEAVEERLFFGGQGCRGGAEAVRPGGIAGGEVGNPPAGDGLQRPARRNRNPGRPRARPRE